MVIIYLVSVKEKMHSISFFSSIATDLQDKYLRIVNNENRSFPER